MSQFMSIPSKCILDISILNSHRHFKFFMSKTKSFQPLTHGKISSITEFWFLDNVSNTRSTNIFMTSSDVPLAYLGYIYFLITQSILVLTLSRSSQHIYYLYSIFRQVKSCIFNPEIILISVLPITTLSCLLKTTSYIHSFICITFCIFQSKYVL